MSARTECAPSLFPKFKPNFEKVVDQSPPTAHIFLVVDRISFLSTFLELAQNTADCIKEKAEAAVSVTLRKKKSIFLALTPTLNLTKL